MTETTKQRKFLWSELRLLLGMAQMVLAQVGLGLLIIVGFRPITWVFIAAAIMAALSSRLIYRGRPDPHLNIGE